MYKPFVRACNCALDQMSKIENVDRLPPFSAEKQIVFVDNHNRSVGSEHVQRNSLTRPDIVLLQWDRFKEKLGRDVPYSDSYDGLRDLSLDSQVVWREVRSTVEMKIAGLPKPGTEIESFDMDFKGLKGLPAYVKLKDDQEPVILHEFLPNSQRECAGMGRFLSLIFLHSQLQGLGK